MLRFSGALDAAAAAGIWHRTVRAAQAARGRPLVLDLSAVTSCDMAGATLIITAERLHEASVDLAGAPEQVLALVGLARRASAPGRPAPPAPPISLREAFRSGLYAAAEGFAFLGEAVVAVIRLPQRRRMVRASDFFRFADQAGVRAMPLVLLLGFLMGLILAFQSAVPMRQFGAELYVANLVSVSLTRELGPLLTAVILSGRTASAYAAEIGTMKVNEEIDALTTMGLDPMSMLVLPRMAAAVVVMPVLTLVLDISGLVGMAVVMRGFGYPLTILENQVQYLDHPERPDPGSGEGSGVRAGDRLGRLPLGAEHGSRAAGGGDVGNRGRRRRYCCHDCAGRDLCRVLQPARLVMADPVIRVDGVSQRFGRRTIYRDVSFTVFQHEVFVILGGSGCGKSTLLKQLDRPAPPRRRTHRDAGPHRHRSRRGRGLARGSASDRRDVPAGRVVWLYDPAAERDAAAGGVHRSTGRCARGSGAGEAGPGGTGGRSGAVPGRDFGRHGEAGGDRQGAWRSIRRCCSSMSPAAGLDPITSAGLDRLILDLRAMSARPSWS